MARERNLTIGIGNQRFLDAGIPPKATVETSRKKFRTSRRMHTLECIAGNHICMSDVRDLGSEDGLKGVMITTEEAIKHNPGLRIMHQNGGLPHTASCPDGKLKLKRSGQFSELQASGIIRSEDDDVMIAVFKETRHSA